MEKIHINQREHKREGKIVYWFNGEKWLKRQTCKSVKKAEELLKNINEWKSLQKI